MRKFSLNPEQLRVESFDTDTPPAGRGTVMARESCYHGCTHADGC